MSWDPPNASRSPGAEHLPADRGLVELVRLRGAPLLDALEAHLPGSRKHAEAAGSYAFAAAVRLGLDRDAAELCRETAKLHDVGMVYVPAAIATVPFDSWDEEERSAFEAHYKAGADLALGSGIPDDVSAWLVRIRERFDGAGPEGLGGDAIPLAARLTRAACALDTLIESPQGGAGPAERRADAIGRLRAAAGHELDPRVVQALVASLGAEA